MLTLFVYILEIFHLIDDSIFLFIKSAGTGSEIKIKSMCYLKLKNIMTSSLILAKKL